MYLPFAYKVFLKGFCLGFSRIDSPKPSYGKKFKLKIVKNYAFNMILNFKLSQRYSEQAVVRHTNSRLTCHAVHTKQK